VIVNSLVKASRYAAASGEYWDAALETRPWIEVERRQVQQIAQMLPALRGRSVMYARLHENVRTNLHLKSLADLADLPFTMKDDIRIAHDQATAAQPLGDNQAASTTDIVQVLSSSGTTGRPLYYGLTAHDVEMSTDAIANTWFTAGLRSNDVVAHLVGLPMVAGGLPYADGFRRIGATLCWLGGFSTERILREMRRLHATALLATTSFGLHLAERWETIGHDTGTRSTLTKALCGGEPGLNQPDIRGRITRGLGILHLREVMGLGDVIPAMWSECAAHDGMHFNAQRHVAVELINPADGEHVQWAAGATGEVVYTTLDRQATPLVRYRSRDHVLVTGAGSCSCGRTSPRIRCIGRTDDMLIYKGMNVFPSAIRDLVAGHFVARAEPLVRIWKASADQVRFDDPIAVDIEAGPNLPSDAHPSLKEDIEREARAQLQVRIQVTVLPSGSLPRSAYKTPLVSVADAVHGAGICNADRES